jgi:hypothetical protein
MNAHPHEDEFRAEWEGPDPHLLRSDLPEPPELPLADVFGDRWAGWLTRAAEAKASPPDYVMAALLACAGALIGNSRWAAPWPGWAEPPVLWTMAVGAPSANKSPGLDAVLSPLKAVERALRAEAEAELTAWGEKAEVAKLAEASWREAVKEALRAGQPTPAKPAAANPGEEPFRPRLLVNDATVERLAVISSKQPRGALMGRDELAGWLQGMARYSNGGSDRPFWLEAYGGRSFTVERMGRPPVQVERLSIGVVGGIQPERLKSLLFRCDDDGLLARFIPVWPNPAPIKRPRSHDEGYFIEAALKRLWSLRMPVEEGGEARPWLVPFAEPARALLDDFRVAVRTWEGEADGLNLSFVGKLPGLAVRLSLVLAYLDWAAEGGGEPQEIGADHFGRAAHLVEAYALPMARRAYCDASASKAERAARKLLALIREQGWDRFSSRDVLRLERSGLGSAAELNPALARLEEGDCVREIIPEAKPRGGRPPRLYLVNPALVAVQP